LTASEDTNSVYQKAAYSTNRTYWTSSMTEIRAGQCHIDIHEINVKEQVSLKTYFAPSTVGMLFLEKGNIHVKQSDTAREYILSDLSFTPTLESIAREVGINVYKLKTGFKALFGQSVFSYLREERLTLAYGEILKNKNSLTDIAYQTGFASISHFSDAFKNRYGISPSQLR
jgi:AraC-like DNA-binding protein